MTDDQTAGQLLLRAVRYLSPFPGMLAGKVGFGVIAIFTALLLPWPLKILIDHVILKIPVDAPVHPFGGPRVGCQEPANGGDRGAVVGRDIPDEVEDRALDGRAPVAAQLDDVGLGDRDLAHHGEGIVARGDPALVRDAVLGDGRRLGEGAVHPRRRAASDDQRRLTARADRRRAQRR